MDRMDSSHRDRSHSQYQVKILYTRVPMRDGVELALKITRPDAEGRFPAILEYNPYRRIKKPLADYREEYPPVVPYLAERGYVIVQFDVRGTGNSSGWTKDIYSAEERQDGYDMVEWTAAQPGAREILQCSRTVASSGAGSPPSESDHSAVGQ